MMEIELEDRNSYVFSLFWSLPLISLVFLVITCIFTLSFDYALILSKTLLIGFGLALALSFLYRLTGSFGISTFTGLLLTSVTGLLPFAWLLFAVVVALLLGVEKGNIGFYLGREQLKKILYSTSALLLVFLPYFGLNFSQPFNEIELANNTLHSDSLYHLAIAAMLKNYFAISHGLHGLSELEYHFGSHIFLSSLSNITRTSVFDAYNYLYVFLVVPLLGISIIAVSEDFFPSKNIGMYKNKLIMYLIVFLGSGVFLPINILGIFALWPSFFQSESYALSLIYLLCLVSFLLNSSSIKASKNVVYAINFLLVCGLVLFTTASKISTGFVGLGLVGSWALLTDKKIFTRDWYYRWILVFLAGAGFLLLLKLINPSMADAGFDFLQFVRSYVTIPLPIWIKVPLFLFLHFIFPLAALFICWGRYKQKALDQIPYWWILGLAGSLILGMAVILLLFVQGGSGYYFSNISMFIALPLVICIPAMFMEHIRKHKKIYTPLVILVLLIHGSPAVAYGVYKFIEGMNAPADGNEFISYIEKLREVRDANDSGNALVHIPRTEIFWEKMYKSPLDYNACRAITYTIPAISERPALYSWPTTECYNFLCSDRFHSDGLCEISDNLFSGRELLEEANKLGFNKVYLITMDSIEVVE